MTFSTQESHGVRQVAESFGSDAARYDRVQPSYPDALVAQIIAVSPGLDVLDVGIGTGIAARQLEASGCRLLGVEVDARMAELARQSGFTVDVSSFENWDPTGRVFDAVVAGQAWHWVDPVVGAAKAADVLRPGGLLAPFWNVFQPSLDVAEAITEVYRRTLPDSPFSNGTVRGRPAYAPIFTKTIDGIRASGTFEEPEEWRFEWDRPYERDEWLDVVPAHRGQGNSRQENWRSCWPASALPSTRSAATHHALLDGCGRRNAKGSIVKQSPT